MNKLGLVLIGNKYHGALGRPRVVVLYDADLGYKQWVRNQVGPECLIVVRWVDAPGLGQGAWVWFMRYEPQMRAMAEGDPNVAFCGLNEVVDDYADAYCVYELDRLAYMHRAGLRSVVGNWSVGVPDLHKWQVYEPVLAAMKAGDLVGLHEYWSHTKDIYNRYHCRRWSIVRQLKDVPIVVTECGRDYLEDTKLGQAGWQRTCNAEEYLGDLREYATLLEEYPQVQGGAVYQAGSDDAQWQPFSVAELWERVVGEYKEVGMPEIQVPQGIVLVLPVRNPVISQYWAEHAVDYSPMPGHPGMDFACPEGTVLRAAHDGIVWVGASYAYKAYGTYCWLECHNEVIGTYWIIYGHGSRILAEHREEVKAGDIIALSGNTGRSTGPHLHLGIETAVPNAGYRDGHDPAFYWWNPGDFIEG